MNVDRGTPTAPGAASAGALTRIAQQAQSRRFIRSLIKSAGVGLTVGTALGTAGVVVDRLVGPGITWWWLVSPSAAAGLAVASVWSWRSRGTELDALRELDQTLMLNDRLGSGFELQQRADENPFDTLAVDEATQYASRVRPREAIRYSLTRAWIAWPIIACIGFGTGTFIEPLKLLTDTEPEAAEAEQQSRVEAAAQAIERAIEALEVPSESDASTPEEPAVAQDAVTDRSRKMLKDIADQLRSNDNADPDRVIAEAQDTIDQELKSLESQEAEQLAREAALQDTFGSLDVQDDTQVSGGSSDSSGTNPASRTAFENALSRGDIAQALRELDQIERDAQSLTGDDKEAFERDLQELADSLRELADDAESRTSEEIDDLRNTLKEQGLTDQQIENLLNANDPDAVRESLEQLGFDPQSAEAIADLIEETIQQQDSIQEAAQTADDFASELDDIAESDATPATDGDSEESPDQDQPLSADQSEEQTTDQDPAQDEAQNPATDTDLPESEGSNDRQEEILEQDPEQSSDQAEPNKSEQGESQTQDPSSETEQADSQSPQEDQQQTQEQGTESPQGTPQQGQGAGQDGQGSSEQSQSGEQQGSQQGNQQSQEQSQSGEPQQGQGNNPEGTQGSQSEQQSNPQEQPENQEQSPSSSGGQQEPGQQGNSAPNQQDEPPAQGEQTPGSQEQQQGGSEQQQQPQEQGQEESGRPTTEPQDGAAGEGGQEAQTEADPSGAQGSSAGEQEGNQQGGSGAQSDDAENDRTGSGGEQAAPQDQAPPDGGQAADGSSQEQTSSNGESDSADRSDSQEGDSGGSSQGGGGPGDSAGSGTQSQTPSNPDDTRTPRERLDDLRKQLDRAEQASRDREQLEQARRMLEQMSPEERAEIQRLAQELMKEQGSEFNTQSLDLRNETQSDQQGQERVRGEIERDPNAQTTVQELDLSDTPLTAQDLLRFKEEAEQSSEFNRVPPSYRKALERYFDQARKRAAGSAPEQSESDSAPNSTEGESETGTRSESTNGSEG